MSSPLLHSHCGLLPNSKAQPEQVGHLMPGLCSKAKPSLQSQRSLLWCKAELEEVTYSLPQFPLRTVIITQEQADQHSQPEPVLPPEREWARSALQIHSSALHYEVISLIGCCTFMHNSSHLAPSGSTSSPLSQAGCRAGCKTPIMRGSIFPLNSSPLLPFRS